MTLKDTDERPATTNKEHEALTCRLEGELAKACGTAHRIYALDPGGIRGDRFAHLKSELLQILEELRSKLCWHG